MNFILTAFFLLATAVWFPAQMNASYSLNPNVGIPNENSVKLAEQFFANGLSEIIFDISVSLDIALGFNGSLYAYMISPQSQLAVLLNQTEITAGNPFSYADSGIKIKFDALAANNIHSYLWAVLQSEIMETRNKLVAKL